LRCCLDVEVWEKAAAETGEEGDRIGRALQ
jgi:hypothetical protein